VKFNIKQFVTNDFEIHKICGTNFQIYFILNKLNIINLFELQLLQKIIRNIENPKILILNTNNFLVNLQL
jgi:hypothetical protein